MTSDSVLFFASQTRMCKHFQTLQVCPFGDRCNFSHGDEELRPSPPPSTQRKSKRSKQPACIKTKMCKNFVQVCSRFLLRISPYPISHQPYTHLQSAARAHNHALLLYM